jgi:hypothetical protein
MPREVKLWEVVTKQSMVLYNRWNILWRGDVSYRTLEEVE